MDVRRSRVVQAIVGAVLAMLVGTSLAAYSAIGGAPTRQTTQNQGTPVVSSLDPTATATDTPSASGDPAPTATPRPCGGSGDLHGTVRDVQSADNYFTLRLSCGSTVRIDVSQSTTYESPVNKLADVQIGWKAEVVCTQTGPTEYIASHVHAEPDN